MPNYEVEVIFEPTGHFMNFTYEAESDNETVTSASNQVNVIIPDTLELPKENLSSEKV